MLYSNYLLDIFLKCLLPGNGIFWLVCIYKLEHDPCRLKWNLEVSNGKRDVCESTEAKWLEAAESSCSKVET